LGQKLVVLFRNKKLHALTIIRSIREQ
ncbi:hypothetical protein BAE44_0016545, partial [Dichanthelium oligosanthes]